MIVTSNWGKKLANKSIEAIMAGPYDVTGVLAFKDGGRMDHATAIKLTNAFWHKTDRIFFGSAASKGFGINRLCFLEFGKSQKCIHSHFVAQSPFDPIAFAAFLNTLWDKFHSSTAKPEDNWISPIEDKLATAEYVTKEVWRFRDDSHLLNCDHGSERPTIYSDFDNEAQLERIINHIEESGFEDALERVPVHMVLIRQRIARRVQVAASRQNKIKFDMANATPAFQKFIQSRQS